MTELERRDAYRAKRDKAQLDAARATLAALKELRSAAIQFRSAAYDAEPTLRVGNEAVNMLSTFLLTAERAIAQAEAAGIK